MSIRIIPAILAAAMFMAFGFPPANAQQPQKPQPPQSLRLYVLDCGIITPLNVDNYGLKPNEVADTKNGHALLPDRSPARNHDLGYR